MTLPPLHASRALWNRSTLQLESDEVLAQILERGEMEAWRALYRLSANDARLRRRIVAITQRVPLPFPRFWRAAMAALGEPVDMSAPLPQDDGA